MLITFGRWTRKKVTNLTVSHVNFFSPQVFTAMWNKISHLKVYKMGFMEKNISYHESPEYFRKKF